MNAVDQIERRLRVLPCFLEKTGCVSFLTLSPSPRGGLPPPHSPGV